MTSEPTDLIEVPPEDMLGEAMLALNPRQRKFVCALSVFGGDIQKAYAYAGYDTKTPGALQAASSRLHTNEKVIEAIREETMRRLGTTQLMAVSTIAELASPLHNPDKTLRLKAAKDILDRVGLAGVTTHNIVVKDERTTANILEAIRALTSDRTVPVQIIEQPKPAQLQDVIEAEFDDGIPDELRDLL